MRCKTHNRPYCVHDACRRAERDAPTTGHSAGIYPHPDPFDTGYAGTESAEGDNPERGSE